MLKVQQIIKTVNYLKMKGMNIDSHKKMEKNSYKKGMNIDSHKKIEKNSYKISCY